MNSGHRSGVKLHTAHLENAPMADITGTVRKLGLEGGLWALVTDDGRTVELIDAPPELCTDGMRAVVTGDRPGGDVTVGMTGDSVRVRSFREL
jgi:hypothetical protein